MTLTYSKDLSGDLVSPWSYILTKEDFDKEWHPKAKRISQLAQNTICTPTGVVSGIWACARGTGPYKGRFPGGYIERFETLMYVFMLVKDFNPNVTKMLFPFGGSVIKRDNLHTVDVKEETNPTFLGSVTNPSFMKQIEDDYYDIVHIDPPYDSENIRYSSRLYNTPQVKPYDFVSKYAGRVGRTDVTKKVKVGGIVAILHQLVYKCIPGCKRVGIIAVTTGPNMRIRVLNLFRRIE